MRGRLFIAENWQGLIAGLLLIAVYFFSRLYNIMALPIFTDEAIYTRWAQIAKHDANWRFISLTDGKQPLFIWLSMIVIPFVPDPLMAGRLVSVFAGFGALTGLFFLSWVVFQNGKIGLLSSLLYLLYPFSLVYDRMALYDSLVSGIAVWVLLFQVLLVRKRRLDVALILGMVLGAGLLTKSSAQFFLYLTPASLFLFNFQDRERDKKFGIWLGLVLVAVILAKGYESVLRLSPLRHIIEQKESVFIYSFSEWLAHPFRFVEGNLKGLWDWFFTYTRLPVVFLILVSFFLGGAKFLREKLLMFIWFIIPFTVTALFGKVLYPRFILFMTMPLIILAAYSLKMFINKVKGVWLKAMVIIFFVTFWLRANYYILTDFAKAPIPGADLEQYISGWPAGGGIKEMVDFLKDQSQGRKIYVLAEGTFGSLPTYALEIYLNENKNIDFDGIWPVPEEMPQELWEKAEKMPVYVVFNQTQKPPEGWPLELLVKYQKGESDSYLSLYKVKGS